MLHSAVVLNIQCQGTMLKSNAIKKKKKKEIKKKINRFFFLKYS